MFQIIIKTFRNYFHKNRINQLFLIIILTTLL